MTNSEVSVIESRPFPTRFAILPSSKYVFSQSRDARELTAQIVLERTLSNGLHVIAVNYGLLAFDFAGTNLGAFDLVEEKSAGVVPDEVTASREHMLEIQAQRLQVAVFVSACIYGRHAHLTHSSLHGPRYPGLDEILGWVKAGTPPEIHMSDQDNERLLPLMRERGIALSKGQSWLASIPSEHVNEGLDLAERVMVANAANEVADFVALIVMTYQAAVLHARQHAGASIALSAMILEVLVEELFYMAGVVNGATARLNPARAHTCKPASKGVLKDMRAADRIEHLKKGGLLDAYLAQRIDEARKARNKLMHRGEDARSTQSGNALTAVRDLLKLCTGEAFELNAAWTYRT